MICIHLLIKGRVQGVFFRSSAKAVADELGISGWVKNTPEGHVEMLACGKEQPLSRFLEWCRKGPVRARVDEVTQKASDMLPSGPFMIIR